MGSNRRRQRTRLHTRPGILGKNLAFQASEKVGGTELWKRDSMVGFFPTDRFICDNKCTGIVKARAHALLHEDPVPLSIGRAFELLGFIASRHSKGWHGIEMRLFDLDGLSVRFRAIFSDKEIAQPWPWLLALKTRLAVSDSKIVGIPDTFFQTVILVVANTLVL